MGYHHLALACKDIHAIHDFYEGVMGFELVKVEVGPVPEGGWAKHFFYRMEDDRKFFWKWKMTVSSIRLSFSPRICGLNPQEINKSHRKFMLNIPLF